MKKEYILLLQRLTIAILFAAIPLFVLFNALISGRSSNYLPFLNGLERHQLATFFLSVSSLVGVFLLSIPQLGKKINWRHLTLNIIFSIGNVPLFFLGLYFAYITSNSLFILWMYFLGYVVSLSIFFLLTSSFYLGKKIPLKPKLVVFGIASILFVIVTSWNLIPSVQSAFDEKRFIVVCNSLTGKKMVQEDLKNLDGTIYPYLSQTVDTQVPIEDSYLKEQVSERSSGSSITVFQGKSTSSRFGNGWRCQVTGKYGEVITDSKASFWLD